MSGSEFEDIRGRLRILEARLEEVEDREAIRNLIVDYARACDQGNDPKLLDPLFTEDAVWECGGFGRYEGRARLCSALQGIAGEKIWWSLHYMISPRIEIDANNNRATVFWYLWESATIPDSVTDKPEPHWIGATYDAIVVKQAGFANRWHARLSKWPILTSPVSRCRKDGLKIVSGAPWEAIANSYRARYSVPSTLRPLA